MNSNTALEENKMRSDYGLYVVAIICFIIAGMVILGANPQYLPHPTTFEATAMTVILTALGLILAILGYALRPKPTISIPEPAKPASPPAPPTTKETPVAPPSAPTPPKPPQEETAEPTRKSPKTRRKRTRRKRKKT